MAEQTYDLTQTGAEVQAIINDAENCKGAGAQTTFTTESILLKDVNGQYHKILKSSFTEAIRDTLAGLLVNNDKGTTINQIAAIASGDFGSVTPANLASVLGAAYWYNNETAADLDNKTTPQTIQYWNPSAGIVTVIVHRDSDSHLSQTKITRDSLYYRYKWNNAWNGWYEVTPPNFYKSYNDISALASGLVAYEDVTISSFSTSTTIQGFGYYGTAEIPTKANYTLINAVIYSGCSSSNPAIFYMNKGTGTSNSYVFTKSQPEGNVVIRFFFMRTS